MVKKASLGIGALAREAPLGLGCRTGFDTWRAERLMLRAPNQHALRISQRHRRPQVINVERAALHLAGLARALGDRAGAPWRFGFSLVVGLELAVGGVFGDPAALDVQ